MSYTKTLEIRRKNIMQMREVLSQIDLYNYLPEWTYHPAEERPHANGYDWMHRFISNENPDKKILIRFNDQDCMMHLSGTSPTQLIDKANGNKELLQKTLEPQAAINISSTRTPQAIANDIKRRLLQDYEERYKLAAAELEQDIADMEQEERDADKLAAIYKGKAGLKHWQSREGQHPTLVHYGTGEDISGTVQTHNGSTHVNLTIKYMDMDTAEKIIKIITTPGE